jgi:predicted SAM-dependent methyltransferase
VKLDLGCGRNCAPGYEGVDIAPLPGVKHVHNLLSFPWPFEPGAVAGIRCSHLIEHLPTLFWTPGSLFGGGDWTRRLTPYQVDATSVDLLLKFFDECGRILAPGGTLLVECPQVHNHRAFQDSTHRRFLVPEFFFYLSAVWRKEMGLEHGAYGISCDFSLKVDHTFPKVPSKEAEMLMRTQQGRRILLERDRERWNVTEDLRVTLVKVDPAEVPAEASKDDVFVMPPVGGPS